MDIKDLTKDATSRVARFKASLEYQELMEHDKWIRLIPKINFSRDWDVQITPPSVGAVVRFRVFKGDAEVSVYLDCYGVLGFYGSPQEPYWEVYPVDEDDTERFAMADTKGLLKSIRKSIRQQNKEGK